MATRGSRFVVEIIDKRDLSNLTCKYADPGLDARYPAVLLVLLVYGYVSDVFSCRKIKQASYGSMAFRFIATNADHNMIATLRRRFLPQVPSLFARVLMLAREMKYLKLAMVSTKAIPIGPIEQIPTDRSAHMTQQPKFA